LPTAPRPNPSMVGLLNEQVIAFARDLKARYRIGLPVLAPTDDERPLRPEEVVNRDLDLGPYENPIVLSLIASRDPMSSTALAASARLIYSAREQTLIGAIATVAGEMSTHVDVRNGLGLAARYKFNPSIAERVADMSLKRVDQDRQRALEQLVNLVNRLRRGENVGNNFVADLLRLSYAANLRPEVLQRTVLSVLESPTLRAKIKLSLIENLHYFPRHLLLAVATQVNRMPFAADHAFLKRELQLALQLNDHMRKNGAAARIARR
jgi:hypothetical protein